MASNSFVSALYQIATEEGNTETLEAIRNLALAKISAGEVKTLINSSLNSKSYSFSVSKPADVLFQEVSEAIRLYNNGIIETTSFNFSMV